MIIIELFLSFISSTLTVYIFLILIVLHQILLFSIRDMSYIKILIDFDDAKDIKLNNLEYIPLITIVIPAWNEGKTFEICLLSIVKMTYPNLKVIINAGGSKETVQIANSFGKFEEFVVIHQEKGSGKIKAINDCLNYISGGIVCILDADVLLTDRLLLKMIYPLINGKERVVTSPIMPHTSIINNDFVKYSYINRYSEFRRKFTRYVKGFSTNACIDYQVIKLLGKFSENKMLDDGTVIGIDLSSKGVKTYKLVGQKMKSFTYPTNTNKFINQNLRWLENSLYYSIKKDKIQVLKFIVLVISSLYILISPLFLFSNVYLSLIGAILFFRMYLKKIRKILFFKLANRENLIKIKVMFLFWVILFIYLDLIVNVIVSFEMVFYRKAYKKRKNLLRE